MRRGEAIKILNKKISEIDALTEASRTAWLTDTIDKMQKFFGIKSSQEMFFAGINFLGVPIDSQDFVNMKESVKSHLSHCIVHLQQMGLYKQPKEKILGRISQEAFVVIFLALLGVTFWGGYFYGSHDRSEEHFELKKRYEILTRDTAILNLENRNLRNFFDSVTQMQKHQIQTNKAASQVPQ